MALTDDAKFTDKFVSMLSCQLGLAQSALANPMYNCMLSPTV